MKTSPLNFSSMTILATVLATVMSMAFSNTAIAQVRPPIFDPNRPGPIGPQPPRGGEGSEIMTFIREQAQFNQQQEQEIHQLQWDNQQQAGSISTLQTAAANLQSYFTTLQANDQALQLRVSNLEANVQRLEEVIRRLGDRDHRPPPPPPPPQMDPPFSRNLVDVPIPLNGIMGNQCLFASIKDPSAKLAANPIWSNGKAVANGMGQILVGQDLGRLNPSTDVVKILDRGALTLWLDYPTDHALHVMVIQSAGPLLNQTGFIELNDIDHANCNISPELRN